LRIIGGKFKGQTFKPPKNLKARPTTDFAREGLMNVLNHKINLNGIRCLDLFSGTGALGFELASRGASEVTCVEISPVHTKYIYQNAQKLNTEINTVKADVFKWLEKSPMQNLDLVIADPPYEIKDMPKLPDIILSSKLLKPEGLFVLEHGKEISFEDHPNFDSHKKYGNVNFSFFWNE
jgi:16S rRNA (guanine966-N2)-methyltransferase